MMKQKLESKLGTFYLFAFLAAICLFFFVIFTYDSNKVGSYYFNLMAHYIGAAFFLAFLFSLRGTNDEKRLKQKIGNVLGFAFVIVLFGFYAHGAWKYTLDLPSALSSNYSSVEGVLKDLTPGRYNENFSVAGIEFTTRRKTNFNHFRFDSNYNRVIYLPNSKFVIDIISIN